MFSLVDKAVDQAVDDFVMDNITRKQSAEENRKQSNEVRLTHFKYFFTLY